MYNVLLGDDWEKSVFKLSHFKIIGCDVTLIKPKKLKLLYEEWEYLGFPAIFGMNHATIQDSHLHGNCETDELCMPYLLVEEKGPFSVVEGLENVPQVIHKKYQHNFDLLGMMPIGNMFPLNTLKRTK